MNLFNLFARGWLGTTGPTNGRKPVPFRRLEMEQLEDREVPAVVGNLPALEPTIDAVFLEAVARDSVPADQFTLNSAEIELDVATPPSAPTPAQVDYFLKLKGIDGESTDTVQVDELDVVSEGEEAEGSPTIAVGGYIRIKKLNSGG